MIFYVKYRYLIVPLTVLICIQAFKVIWDLATLKKQVDDIVGYFEILSKFDDSQNPYDAYPSTQADKLRDDAVVEGLDIPDVKKVSENFMDGYFQVPKVLGEGA